MPFVAKDTTNSLPNKPLTQSTQNSCQLTEKTLDPITTHDDQFNEDCIGPQINTDSICINEQLIPLCTHSHSPPKNGTHFTAVTQHTIGSGFYPYTADLLALANTNIAPGRLPPTRGLHQIITPLNSLAWSAALRHHPDKAFTEYIIGGIRDGFKIGANGVQPLKSAHDNMLSAKVNPSVVTDYLLKEISAGRIKGPLPADIVKLVHTSRFGVIPKRHQVGKWRLILDLSYPEHASVNDAISKSLCSLQYASIDDAARIVSELGPGTELAKIDIAHAYRNVPVHPADRHLLGMMWEGKTYIDSVLPFGLRSAPKIFCAISDALEWILFAKGVSACLHYIDDFLTFGHPGTSQCASNLNMLTSSCHELGLPLAEEKIEGPATVLTFLGIELDTKQMLMRLPQEKLARLKELIRSWRERKATQKRELLSLIGQLAHACKAQAGSF